MPNSTPKPFGPSERRRINRNILLLGLAFMVHFTGFHGTANLQSSVNSDASLGTFTLAAIYGSLILSNIFLPAAVIRWLGCKWTVAVSFVAYMPFIAAQFYPKVYTLIPAGLMVGFGGGPLWCAKCTYLSVVAEPYSKLTGVPAEVLVVRFFGLFFMFYQLAQVWGNLISSSTRHMAYTGASDSCLSNPMDVRTFTGGAKTMPAGQVILHNTFEGPKIVLQGKQLGKELLSSTLFAAETDWVGNATTSPSLRSLLNYSAEYIDNIGATCGANFCGAQKENPNLEPPAAGKVQLIAGVYLGCMLTAALCVAIGVDSLTRYSAGRTAVGTGMSGCRLLAVTLQQLRHKYQLLLLPVIAFIGAEQAFMAADFTAAYVGCAWGIEKIGYVMICFGVFNAVAAPLAGLLVRTTGRYPVMLAALVLHLSVMTTLLLWRPRPDRPLMFFALAALWGTADAVWLVQVNALSGILFPGQEEAAFSNFRLWEATGSVLAYAASPYVCTATKLYALLALLLSGMACYSAIELMEYRTKKAHHLERDFELVDKKVEE